MKKDNPLLYRFFRPIVYFLVKLVFRPKIIGLENIPKQGGFVLAGTHTSIFDCFLMMSSTKRTVHFLAKKELWKWPLGIIIGSMGLVPVDRSIHDKNALKEAENYLKDGCVVLVFPEGTTQKGRGLLPFKIGAVKMASDKDVPIVPFAITGKYRPFFNDLKLVVGKPLTVSKKKDLTEDNNHLREVVKGLLEEEK